MARVCLALTTMPDLDQIEGNLKILMETNKGVKLSETIKLRTLSNDPLYCHFIVNPLVQLFGTLEQGKLKLCLILT